MVAFLFCVYLHYQKQTNDKASKHNRKKPTAQRLFSESSNEPIRQNLWGVCGDYESCRQSWQQGARDTNHFTDNCSQNMIATTVHDNKIRTTTNTNLLRWLCKKKNFITSKLYNGTSVFYFTFFIFPMSKRLTKDPQDKNIT